MSVNVQARPGHEKFAVNSTHFEEITSKRDEHTKKPSSPINSTERQKTRTFSEQDSRSEKDMEKGRSKSPVHSDYSDDYEDDFDNESRPPSGKRASEKATISKRRQDSPSRRSPVSNSSRSPRTSSPAKSPSILSPRSERKSHMGKSKKRRSYGYESSLYRYPGSTKHVEKSWGKPKHNSAKAPRLGQEVVDRVLSANRNKVTQLENRLSQLIKELIEEREENKTLRQVVHRQEKRLKEVCGDQADLPKLINKHTSEVKSMREMIKRLQDTGNQKDNKIHDLDKESLKLKDRCKYYRDLCESKNLLESEALQKKLTQNEGTLEKRNEELSKLQRMVNLQEKSHARQVKELNLKIRELQSKTKEMEQNYSNQQDRIETMTRQLNYGNIYQRQIVLKNKDKNNALPEAKPKMAALPAPKPTKKKVKKTPTNGAANKTTNDKDNDKENDVEKKDTNKKPDSFFLTTHSDTGSDREPDKDKGVNEKSDEPRLSITDGREGLAKEEDRLKEEEEKRKREEFERSLREEDERLRKQKEEAERIKRELEERTKREEAEREAKWREDSARKAREEQERQEAMARRAREEEEQRKKAEEDIFAKPNFFEDDAERRKKDQLLARMRAIDHDQKGHDTGPAKSGDEFHNPIRGGHEARSEDKNLHNGLPAKPNPIISPPESVKSDPDSVSGVPRNKPVLLGRGALARKSNVPSWLDKKPPTTKQNARSDGTFTLGDYSPTITNTQSKPQADTSTDIFGTGRRGPGRGRRGPNDNNNNTFDFGGGADKPRKTNNNPSSFFDDDFGRKKNADAFSTKSNVSDDFWNTGPTSVNSPPAQNNSSLLPLRRKEKPAPVVGTSMFDNLDDDIEELVL